MRQTFLIDTTGFLIRLIRLGSMRDTMIPSLYRATPRAARCQGFPWNGKPCLFIYLLMNTGAHLIQP